MCTRSRRQVSRFACFFLWWQNAKKRPSSSSSTSTHCGPEGEGGSKKARLSPESGGGSYSGSGGSGSGAVVGNGAVSDRLVRHDSDAVVGIGACGGDAGAGATQVRFRLLIGLVFYRFPPGVCGVRPQGRLCLQSFSSEIAYRPAENPSRAQSLCSTCAQPNGRVDAAYFTSSYFSHSNYSVCLLRCLCRCRCRCRSPPDPGRFSVWPGEWCGRGAHGGACSRTAGTVAGRFRFLPPVRLLFRQQEQPAPRKETAPKARPKNRGREDRPRLVTAASNPAPPAAPPSQSTARARIMPLRATV